MAVGRSLDLRPVAPYGRGTLCPLSHRFVCANTHVKDEGVYGHQGELLVLGPHLWAILAYDLLLRRAT